MRADDRVDADFVKALEAARQQYADDVGRPAEVARIVQYARNALGEGGVAYRMMDVFVEHGLARWIHIEGDYWRCGFDDDFATWLALASDETG